MAVALPPIPNVLRVQFKGTNGTAKWLNGIYLQYTGAPAAEADLTFLAGAFDDDWLTHIGPLVNLGNILTAVNIQDMHSVDGAGVEVTTTKTGTGGASNMPISVSACVSLKQSRRFRGGHPRLYLPPPSSTSITTPNQWTTTYKNLVETNMAAFKTAIQARTAPSTTGLLWVTVSRYSGHTLDGNGNRIPTPLPAPIVRAVVSLSCSTRIDSQRRRLGRGF